MDKWRVDEFYDATILAASRLLARFLAAYDKYVVDGILSEVTSQTIKAASYLFTRMQNGLVHAYGTAMAVGLLAVTCYFIVPHAKPTLENESGYTAKLSADKGFAYEYRWDFDGDGKFDTTWGPEPAAEHEFSPNDIHAYAVLFEPASLSGRIGANADPQRLELRPGKSLRLSPEQLGPTWQTNSEGGLPRIVAESDAVVIEPNGAQVRKGSDLVKSSVRLTRGEHVAIGEARLTVTGLVRTRLAVRNAFGMELVRTLELPLPKVEPRVQARIAGLAGVRP
jgi:NADH-quinone oxidoreductase subunit L